MATAARDPDCIFCKIIDKQIPATVVSEDTEYVAIRDINPQAPVHILILPREHMPDITSVKDANALGTLFAAASSIAAKEGIRNGFRLVVNTGSESGQSVFHLHIHLLGGRPMRWPPG
jgi:histidine triad (HIT) family protein